MNHHQQQNQLSYGGDPNTTFVQAEPSTFRTIVQQLTGSSSPSSSAQKLPLTPKKQAFKLHERRQSTKKLELKLHNNTNNVNSSDPFCFFPQQQQRGGFLVSPVSHFDHFWGHVSPHSPRVESHAINGVADEAEEEQKAIAEKGFYLHRSPRGGTEPELLPLFPLHSPRDNDHINDNHCHS